MWCFDKKGGFHLTSQSVIFHDIEQHFLFRNFFYFLCANCVKRLLSLPLQVGQILNLLLEATILAIEAFAASRQPITDKLRKSLGYQVLAHPRYKCACTCVFVRYQCREFFPIVLLLSDLVEIICYHWSISQSFSCQILILLIDSTDLLRKSFIANCFLLVLKQLYYISAR